MNSIEKVFGQFNPFKLMKDIPCPNCGTLHAANVTRWNKYYLDGIPQGNIEKLLERYPICTKCGCIYGENTDACYEGTDIDNIVATEDYQTLLTSDLPAAEKKLKLMLLFPYGFPRTEGWLAHYYDRIDSMRNEWLTRAIASAHKENGPYGNAVTISGKFFSQLDIGDKIAITPRLYLIDLYRRAGNFTSAIALIQEEKDAEYYTRAVNIQKYIQKQETLIDKHYTRII